MVDKKIIDDALVRFDLLEEVKKKVRLSRRGERYAGLCPFHEEKTPSFYCDSRHYNCYGCGLHGNAIDWLRDVEGLSFPEALVHIGVELKQFQREDCDGKLPAFDIDSRIEECRKRLPLEPLLKCLVHARLGNLSEKVFISLLPRYRQDEIELLCEVYGLDPNDYICRAQALRLWESLIDRLARQGYRPSSLKVSR